MIAIDQAIENVERLYRNLTGRDAPAPDAVFAPIPAERDPGEHVEEQLDRLLGVLSGQAAPGISPSTDLAPGRVPAVAVYEGEREYVLRVELPGVTRDQVEVSVQGNDLLVSGKVQEQTDPALTLRATETPLAPFRRTMPLPTGVKTSELAAQLRDGLLEIRIAREEKPAPEARTIPVG